MITLRTFAAAFIVLAALSTSARASTAHPCASDAFKRAVKLLALQAESDQPGSIGKSVAVMKAVRNPANNKQKFDVLAISGFVYKAEYRMRFLYAQIPGQCALVGQEILEDTSI